MEVFVALVIIACALSAIWFLLKVTFAVSIHDPKFAAKALASGLASSAIGYLVDGQVVIKVVVWGIGGCVLYIAYKYALDHP